MRRGACAIPRIALVNLQIPGVTLWVPWAILRTTLVILRIASGIILRTSGVTVRTGRPIPRAPGAIRGITCPIPRVARPIRRSL